MLCHQIEANVSVCVQGCASWKWYFPFHYAPFASDFKDIKRMFTEFEKGTKPVRTDSRRLCPSVPARVRGGALKEDEWLLNSRDLPHHRYSPQRCNDPVFKNMHISWCLQIIILISKLTFCIKIFSAYSCHRLFSFSSGFRCAE